MPVIVLIDSDKFSVNLNGVSYEFKWKVFTGNYN